MVYFVCEQCNETLKKNQVEKHLNKCRNCEAVTCVDCSVTFYGDDYRAHNTCISEAEKYEKSVFQERKTKANPQQAWLESIESACSDRSLDSKMKLWLSQMLNYQNVPRNRKKFLNFCVNSLKLKDEMTALAAFEAISAYSKCSLLDDTANVIHHVPACRKRNSSGDNGEFMTKKVRYLLKLQRQ